MCKDATPDQGAPESHALTETPLLPPPPTPSLLSVASGETFGVAPEPHCPFPPSSPATTSLSGPPPSSVAPSEPSGAVTPVCYTLTVAPLLPKVLVLLLFLNVHVSSLVASFVNATNCWVACLMICFVLSTKVLVMDKTLVYLFFPKYIIHEYRDNIMQ